jgi:hypothetical protein
MTKAELQERAFKLNDALTFAIASLEATGESMPGSKMGTVLSILANETRNRAGDAWIDGEKQ